MLITYKTWPMVPVYLTSADSSVFHYSIFWVANGIHKGMQIVNIILCMHCTVGRYTGHFSVSNSRDGHSPHKNTHTFSEETHHFCNWNHVLLIEQLKQYHYSIDSGAIVADCTLCYWEISWSSRASEFDRWHFVDYKKTANPWTHILRHRDTLYGKVRYPSPKVK